MSPGPARTASRRWDLAIVGAGPAGAAAAIGALRSDPSLSVLLLDRATFPRDKPCGDGIAPQVFDLLDAYGVTGLVDDQVPVPTLRLVRGELTAVRRMHRPAWVVPRTTFDARLLQAALELGAELTTSRVRSVQATEDGVRLDHEVEASVVVGADGAHSVVARSGDPVRGRSAFALRGYAPTPTQRRGEQVIVFGDTRQPSYAWSFDRGDGWANVGYGELVTSTRPPPTRQLLLDQLERLLPGATRNGRMWRGHHLPLAPARWRPPDGPVLLAGDAARLVNPLTGEGIYYAVLTGLLAGVSAAQAIGRSGAAVGSGRDPGRDAGRRYRRAVVPALRAHLVSTAAAARVAATGPVLDAGLRAAAADQAVFDDLVDLGLAEGVLTARLGRALARELGRELGRELTGRLGRGADSPLP